MSTLNDTAIDWLSELLQRAADAEIMPRFRTLAPADIRQKTSATDLVTEADERAERLITAELLQRFPGALVVGEEATEKDGSMLEKLPAADLAFVIDPVDGTFNFASGMPLFGVMLSVVEKGETVAGLIYDPVGRDWLVGVSGGGSYIRSTDGSRKVGVAAPAPVSQMTGSISWSYLKDPLRSRLARNHAKCMSSFGYRCAAHEYRLLATGSGHFLVYHKLMPWDHLAGALIHREAGGYSAHFDGSLYKVGHLEGGLLVAPDRDSWRELREALWAE
ncbi:MAG: inositol monophosphatase family protein [Rhizobiaceae bacterium]